MRQTDGRTGPTLNAAICWMTEEQCVSQVPRLWAVDRKWRPARSI